MAKFFALVRGPIDGPLPGHNREQGAIPATTLHGSNLAVHPTRWRLHVRFRRGEQGFWLDSTRWSDGYRAFSVMVERNGLWAEHGHLSVADRE